MKKPDQPRTGKTRKAVRAKPPKPKRKLPMKPKTRKMPKGSEGEPNPFSL
jgi:hypothetical protein